jgi:hypothetical protein
MKNTQEDFMKKSIALFLIVAVFSMSCATIITGTDQEMQIGSKPAGASFVIYDNYNMEVWNGTTPSTVVLPKGDGFFKGANYRLTITKPGYETQSIQIRAKLNGGWYLAGNCFSVGGSAGLL